MSFKEAQDSDASAVDLQDGQIFTFEIPSAIAARALGGPPQNGAAGGCERCSKRNFRWVNRYRKSKNLGRIRWRANLAALAMKHSKKMYDTKVFAHSNYPYAENIAFA